MVKQNEELLVSVIIPIKNPDEDVFSECLKSIQSQSYSNLELIIVDASINKPLIINECGNKLIYIRQKRNNLGGGRQDALEIANGRFILNIDSDCIADKNWVREMINSFNESNSEVIVIGRSLSFNENSVTKEIQDEYDNWINSVTCRLNGKTYCITVDGKNFGFIKDFGYKIGFDQDLVASEDMDFAARARRNGLKIIYNENAVIYHKHRQNIKSLIRQKIWHGTGYGQNMVKNDIDFEMHMQLKRSLMLLGAILLFPITVTILLAKLWKLDNASRNGFFFKIICYGSFIYGTIKGMYIQGGLRFLIKKAKSELQFSCEESYYKL